MPGEVTRLLQEAREGDRAAAEQLYERVYAELRRIARRQLVQERAGHTLAPTAVVNEAYLKLMDSGQPEWQDRTHFFRIAARAMRQVLIDYARRRGAGKRGGSWQRTTFSNDPGFRVPLEEVLALDAALDRLGKADERLLQVIELSFFGGLTEQEIASLMGVSERTVRRDWVKARAWLYKELYGSG